MNPLVQKELRAILPAWILGLLAVIAPMALFAAVKSEGLPGIPPFLLYFALGWVTLVFGTAAFGQEFSHGTFQLLLAQPVSRNRLWWTKVGLAATAAVSALAVLLVGHSVFAHLTDAPALSRNAQWICVAIVAAGFTGALWTTLLLRQEVAAFCVSVLVPGLIAIITAKLLEAHPPNTILASTLATLGIYSVVAFLFANRLFARAQDVQWTGGTVALPKWFASRAETSDRPRPSRMSALAALIRKEFQSHHVNWMLAGALALLHVAMILVQKAQGGTWNLQGNDSTLFAILFLCWFLVWLALPFLIGGIAVAEERRLGTFEDLLCLPVSRTAQFLIKLGVAIFLTVLFCAVIPYVIQFTAIGIGPPKAAPMPDLSDLKFLVMLLIGMTCVSFYASTLTRNTLQAIGTAFVLNLPLLALGARAYGMAFDTTQRHTLWELPLIMHIGVATLLVLWLWLAWRNFGQVQAGARMWTTNGAAGVAALCFAVGATFLIYNRTWEKFMVLEPAHGPVRLSGTVRPQICDLYPHVLVLLPDGRIWVSTTTEWVYGIRPPESAWESTPTTGREPEPLDVLPRSGRFLARSNWICIDGSVSSGSGYGVTAIRSDGTLWAISFAREWRRPPGPGIHTSPLPEPEQIGDERDWKWVAGSYALKNDGTIWLVLPAIPAFRSHISPMIPGTDWSHIFAGHIGVKNDGSVWKWGRLSSMPDGSSAVPSLFRTNPVPWSLSGSNWIERVGSSFDLVLHGDGSLSGLGWLPENVLGEVHKFQFVREPRRIRTDRTWTDLAGNANITAAIDSNGQLVYSMGRAVMAFPRARTPSAHSDWIAVETSWNRVIALAADGTLSMWKSDRDERGGPTRMLAPTRKPTWSLNILHVL